MKKVGIGLLLLMVHILPVAAQVTVEVALDQDQFLPGEAIAAGVRIANRSGQPLRLGATDDWLTFSVESLDGYVVSKTGEVPVAGEFVVDSSKRATKHVDLAPYFSMTRPGHYSVTATVKLKDWEKETASPAKSFTVIEGAKLWEEEVGLPRLNETNGTAPEVRKYILQQANYLKGQLRLYVRVTDTSGLKVFRTLPIGMMLSFSRPEPRVDKFSNLHLLYQSWAHTFSYTVVNPDGEIIVHQSYDFIGTRPRLDVDNQGNVTVSGGVRRVTANDRPAPVSVSNDVHAPSP